MIYLEEYLPLFIRAGITSGPRPIPSNDHDFLCSIYEQMLGDGRALTTRQGAVLKRIYSKYADIVSGISTQELREAIRRDYWKTELRVSTQRRQEARYIGDNLVALSYTTTPSTKTLTSKLNAIWRNKLHIVSVNRYTIDGLIDFIGQFGLEMDSATEEYLALCLSSKKQISHFIVVGKGVAVNVCDDELLATYIQCACGGMVL